MKLSTTLLGLALIAFSSQETVEHDLLDYLPFQPGYSWTYRVSGETASVEVDLSATTFGDANALERRATDGTRSVLGIDSEDGLRLYAAFPSNGESIEYERPVILLPPRLKVGEPHSSQRRFVYRVDGEKRDVGAHYFEAELLGVEAVETPMGSFENALKIRRSEVRMDFSGAQVSLALTEWYARGVGLVKAEGERVFKNERGETVRTKRIDRVLTEARIPPRDVR